jgi:histidinol-phosphate/aromatic aminotransferase/cobyric acid decarboxylase-like protein
MANHVNKYFSPATTVEPKHVLMANGVSAICSMLGFLVGDPGDGVLLMRPIYGKFENDWGIMAGYEKLITLCHGFTCPF